MNIHSNKIIPYLYVGSKDDLYESNTDSFDFIVNCTVNIPFPKYYTKLKLRIPIEEETTDIQKFIEMILYTNVLEKILKTISSKKNVLVYSNTGNNRACIVIACFLIKYMKIIPNQAIHYICQNRKDAFQQQENNLMINTIFYYYDYLHLHLEKKHKQLSQKIDQNQTAKLINNSHET